MKQVKVYQTRDNQTFVNRLDAENHEFKLNIRALIQSHVKGDSFTPMEIANILSKEHNKLFDTLSKYRKTMATLKGIATKNQTIGL